MCLLPNPHLSAPSSFPPPHSAMHSPHLACGRCHPMLHREAETEESGSRIRWVLAHEERERVHLFDGRSISKRLCKFGSRVCRDRRRMTKRDRTREVRRSFGKKAKKPICTAFRPGTFGFPTSPAPGLLLPRPAPRHRSSSLSPTFNRHMCASHPKRLVSPHVDAPRRCSKKAKK